MLSAAPETPANAFQKTREQHPTVLAQLARASDHTMVISILWILVIATILSAIVLVAPVPPLIESDYCYLLTAADRFVDGHGLTTTLPLAPHQTWAWRSDWTFLTRWPVGFSLIVAGMRSTLGVTSIAACKWVSVIACAIALVGWFRFTLRLVPAGVTRYVLAAACAGLSLPVAWLVNPSTDLLIVALLPWLMMLAERAVHDIRVSAQAKACGSEEKSDLGSLCGTGLQPMRSVSLVAIVGFACGSLFWIRYASIFVPLSFGGYLLYERIVRRSITRSQLLSFAIAAAIPISAILVMSAAFGAGESAGAQLNLGDRVGFDFSLSIIARAWWMFTDLGYYSHHPIAHVVFASWPVVLVGACLCFARLRSAVRQWVNMPGVALSVFVVAALLSMLIAAKTFFAGKFDYVGLARYYQPVKPLYLVIFVAPCLTMRSKWFRGMVCVFLVVACSWTLQQSWMRTHARWRNADRATTPSGSWSRCFEPGAGELYQWLGAQDHNATLVLCNFHEYVTLETKIPAIPIPPDRATLDRWMTQIAAARNVQRLRVLFVLDPDNRWRDYWLDAPDDIVRRFGLTHTKEVPASIAQYIYELPAQVASTTSP